MKNLSHSHKFLVCLGLTAMSVCANAADWVSLGLADLGTYGIDRASIEKDGSLRRVWTKLDYSEALTSEGVFDAWQALAPNTPVFTMFKVVCEH